MLVDIAAVMETVPGSLVVEVGSRSCQSRLPDMDTEMVGVGDDVVEETDTHDDPEQILVMDDTLEEERRVVLDWELDSYCQDEPFFQEPLL